MQNKHAPGVFSLILRPTHSVMTNEVVLIKRIEKKTKYNSSFWFKHIGYHKWNKNSKSGVDEGRERRGRKGKVREWKRVCGSVFEKGARHDGNVVVVMVVVDR